MEFSKGTPEKINVVVAEIKDQTATVSLTLHDKYGEGVKTNSTLLTNKPKQVSGNTDDVYPSRRFFQNYVRDKIRNYWYDTSSYVK